MACDVADKLSQSSATDAATHTIGQSGRVETHLPNTGQLRIHLECKHLSDPNTQRRQPLVQIQEIVAVHMEHVTVFSIRHDIPQYRIIATHFIRLPIRKREAIESVENRGLRLRQRHRGKIGQLGYPETLVADKGCTDQLVDLR